LGAKLTGGVLGIDTAAPVVGVGYYSESSAASWEHRIIKGADAKLMPVVERYIQEYSIDYIAITVGPGTFTGLRVGISIALGLAFSLQKKIIPVSSLMARSSLIRQDKCLSILDARKNKVYAQVYDASPNLPVPLTEAVDAPLEDLPLNSVDFAVGEGAIRYRDLLMKEGIKVVSDAARSPALEVARLGWILRESAVLASDIQPRYLRSAGVSPPKGLGQPVGKPRIQ